VMDVTKFARTAVATFENVEFVHLCPSPGAC